MILTQRRTGSDQNEINLVQNFFRVILFNFKLNNFNINNLFGINLIVTG